MARVSWMVLALCLVLVGMSRTEAGETESAMPQSSAVDSAKTDSGSASASKSEPASKVRYTEVEEVDADAARAQCLQCIEEAYSQLKELESTDFTSNAKRNVLFIKRNLLFLTKKRSPSFADSFKSYLTECCL